jgi:hypothetical protein
VKEVEAHAASLPMQYSEFGHFLPADWLYQHEDEGAKLPGFSSALANMEKLITQLNSLL